MYCYKVYAFYSLVIYFTRTFHMALVFGPQALSDCITPYITDCTCVYNIFPTIKLEVPFGIINIHISSNMPKIHCTVSTSNHSLYHTLHCFTNFCLLLPSVAQGILSVNFRMVMTGKNHNHLILLLFLK